MVGIPRTGFSLLISIINQIRQSVDAPPDRMQLRMTALSETFGQDLGLAIESSFADHGLSELMMFNDNFRYLLGGPVWNMGDLGRRAYFRKYVGVDGSKDFTLIASLPIESLLRYPVVYSHGPASDWTSNVDLQLGARFASMRNPAGTINSACFSINALASEYITKRMPTADSESLRYELASYKLSSHKFFDALLRPLKSGLEDLLSVKDKYHIVSWEDVITQPEATISRLGHLLGLELKTNVARTIWKRISYRNLTGAHRHNYRVGKAFVGDEKDSLVNEHIELLKQSGVDDLAVEFGYPKLDFFDPSKYSPFQERVSNAWRRGEELNDCKDPTLFEFAFNKSNLDFSEFGYRSHEWLTDCRIERSGLPEEALEIDVASRANQSLASLSQLVDFVSQTSDEPWRHKDFVREARSLRWSRQDLVESWSDSMRQRVGGRRWR